MADWHTIHTVKVALYLAHDRYMQNATRKCLSFYYYWRDIIALVVPFNQNIGCTCPTCPLGIDDYININVLHTTSLNDGS